jgi:putative inorganic carbon (hco3(-)) transporter
VSTAVAVSGTARPASGLGPALIVGALKIPHAMSAFPCLAFLLALTAMLFRPPDLRSFPWDRIAFLFLACVIAIRFCIRRERPRTFPATWPLLALLLLGLWNVLAQPYEAQAWSLLVAKWIVPFALFHIAGLVFCDESSLRKLEVFCLVVLVYLAAISVFFLVDAHSLIFPKFILDGSIGIHAERARGPFLQAVANGVCLNILGLIALDSFRKKRLRSLLPAMLFLAVPLAILATKTRSVWLSSALSIGFLVIAGSERRLRRAALGLFAIAVIGWLGILMYRLNSSALTERLADRSPVDFRLEMYQAGWQMFIEKPLTGWGTDASIQGELARRISDFRPDYYVFHNTYLELAAQCGLIGLGLYAWLVLCFFRLARSPKESQAEGAHFMDSGFRKLWPVMVGVYLLNASVVVMNYQFVNGLMFTLAGILAAQERESFVGCRRAV